MPNECPSVEEIAAYIDHGLLPEERQQIEAHLLDCQACRQLIADVIKSQSIVPDPVIDCSHHS